MEVPLRNLPKHQKYAAQYKPNDIFWGLGVEHETYLEATPQRQVPVSFIMNNRKPERYSVNYYSNYILDSLNEAFTSLFPDLSATYDLPILLNSHSFNCLDASGEHRTTYERNPKPNPKFNGEFLIDTIRNHNSYLNKEYEQSYIFDGDTIEFMTQRYYKATVDKVIDELTQIETEFISNLNSTFQSLNILSPYLPFQIQTKNHPFANHLTNLKNPSMFNNGTMHVNITLPTRLDASNQIADFDLFVEQHKNFARVIQWIEPLQAAFYGSPDPFSTVDSKFSATSQRLAVSRYICLGTYDTATMPLGKILQVPNTYSWLKEYHQESAYNSLSQIGLDLNFYKHFNHGLEIRYFDSVPIADLEEILKSFVHLADFSLQNPDLPTNRHPIWEQVTKKILANGKSTPLTQEELEFYWRLFKINKKYELDESAEQLYNDIIFHLKSIDGACCKYFFGESQINFVKEVESTSCWCSYC